MVHQFLSGDLPFGLLPKLDLAWPCHLHWQVQLYSCSRVNFIHLTHQALCQVVWNPQLDPDFQRAKLCGESRGYLVVIFWW